MATTSTGWFITAIVSTVFTSPSNGSGGGAAAPIAAQHPGSEPLTTGVPLHLEDHLEAATIIGDAIGQPGLGLLDIGGQTNFGVVV